MEYSNKTKKENDFSAIRMREPIKKTPGIYTAKNSSKGSLLPEAKILFGFLANEIASLAAARKEVIKKNIFNKKTFHSKNTCWKVLHARYFSGSPDDVSSHPLVALFRNSSNSSLLEGALYYHFMKGDRLYNDITVDLLFQFFRQGKAHLSALDIHEFMKAKSADHPEIEKWSPQTRRSLINHYLSSIKDFGLFEGKYVKKLKKPFVHEDLFLYIVTLLKDSQHKPSNILKNDDFRLFLLSETEVASKLYEASQKKKIKFYQSGQTVSLQLPWESLDEYIRNIGS